MGAVHEADMLIDKLRRKGVNCKRQRRKEVEVTVNNVGAYSEL